MSYNKGAFSERQVVFIIWRSERDWSVKNLRKVENETTFAFEGASKKSGTQIACAIKVEPRF